MSILLANFILLVNFNNFELFLFCSDIDVIAKKLHHLSQQSGYTIQQQHGQRIYGGPPPDWTGPPPERGTEVGLEDAFQLPKTIAAFAFD